MIILSSLCRFSSSSRFLLRFLSSVCVCAWVHIDNHHQQHRQQIVEDYKRAKWRRKRRWHKQWKFYVWATLVSIDWVEHKTTNLSNILLKWCDCKSLWSKPFILSEPSNEMRNTSRMHNQYTLVLYVYLCYIVTNSLCWFFSFLLHACLSLSLSSVLLTVIVHNKWRIYI